MIDYSLSEKFKILFTTISASYFFIVVSIIGLIILGISIFNIIKRKKMDKRIYIISWIFVIAFILIRYWSFISQLGDNFVNNVFMSIYFPNLAIYMTMFIVANGFFIYSVIRKNIPKSHKLANMVYAVIFDFLFILIIDSISKNNINVYSSLDVYTNPNLLVLIELSSGLTLLWIISSIFIHALVIMKKRRIEQLTPTPVKELVTESPTTVTVDGLVSDLPNQREQVPKKDPAFNIIPNNANSIITSTVDKKDSLNIASTFNQPNYSLSQDSQKMWKTKDMSANLINDKISLYKVLAPFANLNNNNMKSWRTVTNE